MNHTFDRSHRRFINIHELSMI